ncbi:MAG: hypothetical protein ACRC0C_03665 [Gibbsiella quercinecans]|uniref:hypothetical protein n=1 Tax=Gibbsiella quercinecans TaxID=929813 RepID=UPI003F3CFD09
MACLRHANTAPPISLPPTGLLHADLDPLNEEIQQSAHSARLAARFDSGDRLHPGDEGNRALAAAVDLQALLSDLKLPATTQEH